MAVRAPDFMVSKRLYRGYRLTLGEGARSVVMDDDSLKNVLSNRDPLDSEKIIMFLSPQEKREWDVFFNETIRRSDFFVYQPTFNPTPREGYFVFGRVKNSAILSQRLVDPEDGGERAWEVEIEVEFYSRRPLRAPLELYPQDPSINVVELIHIPRNQRSRFDSIYQDPIPLDWTGVVRVDNLMQRRPPRFVMPDINQTSSMIIRYGSQIDLQGFTPLDSMGDKVVPMDAASRTDGEYTFSTRGVIFYNTTGSSYVYPFRGGEFLPRAEIWRRRGAAQDSGTRPFGAGWAEVRNPALLNNLGFIAGSNFEDLDDLNVLLLSRRLTDDEMDAIIAAQPPF